jgi:hypothetical protein
MVEIFDRDQFQAAMPPKATCLGLMMGEYVWAIPMPNPKIRLIVRSSIHAEGHSAGTGEDSIRLWMEGFDGTKWYSMGQKPDAYSTRIKGWQQRIKIKIQTVAKIAAKVPGNFMVPDGDKIYFVKQGKNQGRPFLSYKGNFVKFVDGR